MTPGLDHCENVVIVPHIASASLWTRSGMVGSCIQGMPLLCWLLDSLTQGSLLEGRRRQQSQCFCIVRLGMPQLIDTFQDVSHLCVTTVYAC